MHTPQIIYIILVAFSLLLGANQHGKPKEGNNNFWIELIVLLLSVGLLFWGGFFII